MNEAGGRGGEQNPNEHGGSVAPALLFREHAAVDAALTESLAQWDKIPVHGSWLVNSHPKSGTHLLRNILLHFNSGAVHREMLFFDNFALITDDRQPRIYSGHLPYSPLHAALPQIGPLRTMLLLRHPCAVAAALARAFYDVNTQRPDHLYMRAHSGFEEIVRNVVCGYACEGMTFAPLASSLSVFSVDWRDTAEIMLRFEDIIAALGRNDRDLSEFFRPLLLEMFGAIPGDAARRIRAGSATAISATYSRTAPGHHAELTEDHVYSLLPKTAAAELRGIAAVLGYP